MTQRLLKTLLVSLGAWGVGLADDREAFALEAVPEEALETALERCSELESGATRRHLLSALAQDSRAQIRCRVAQEAAAVVGPIDGLWADELLLSLASDPHFAVRRAAARGVAHRLGRLTESARLRRAEELAHSARTAHRVCLGRALTELPPHGADVALFERLCTDEVVEVRREAVRALGSRFEAYPREVAWLLQKALDDVDPKVARRARKISDGGSFVV